MMKKMAFALLLIPVLFTACKKRNVTVYNCTCKWVRAATNTDTSMSFTIPDYVKGTSESTCQNEKTIIPQDTDVKDSITCVLN